MAIALRYAARSDVGLGRYSNNQDSGVRRAAPARRRRRHGRPRRRRRRQLDRRRRAGRTSTARRTAATTRLDLLASSLRAANAELRDRDGRGRRRACTAWARPSIAILRTGNKLALAHIGDSRGYLLRDGNLTQITHDHSFVQTPGRRGPDHRGGGRAPPAALPGHPGPHRQRRTTSPTCRCARRGPATATCSAPTGCPASSARRHHRRDRWRGTRRRRARRPAGRARAAGRRAATTSPASSADVVDLDAGRRPVHGAARWSAPPPPHANRDARPPPAAPAAQGRGAGPPGAGAGERRRADGRRSPRTAAPAPARALAAPRRWSPLLVAVVARRRRVRRVRLDPAAVLRRGGRRPRRDLPRAAAGPRPGRAVAASTSGRTSPSDGTCPRTAATRCEHTIATDDLADAAGPSLRDSLRHQAVALRDVAHGRRAGRHRDTDAADAPPTPLDDARRRDVHDRQHARADGHRRAPAGTG